MSPASYKDSFRGRTVCVTGGAGFIGSHLVDALLQHGASVRVIDDFSNGREENLRDALTAAGPRLTVVRGSVTDDAALDRAVAGCSVVFHQAALGSVPRSIEIPAKYHEVNAGGTLKVMEAARRHHVRRVVYAASSSAYGDTPTLPKVETMRPDPLSPYAYTKLAGESIMRSWSLCYGISAVSLRYFNIFGPRQREDSQYAAVVPLFAKALRSGTPAVIFGDGGTTRDFTHVKNAVHANMLAGASSAQLRGEVVNIACGAKYSLLELLHAMAKIMGCTATPEFKPGRTGDIRESLADINAAKRLLGYEVIVKFEEGLKEMLQAGAAGSAAPASPTAQAR